MPDGTHAGPLDPGANGVGHARAEEPVVRRVKVGEADDMPPDVLGRGVDHHRGLAGEEQGLGFREMFGAHHRRQEGEQDDHDLAEIAGLFGSKFHDEVTDHNAEDHDRHGERQHHGCQFAEHLYRLRGVFCWKTQGFQGEGGNATTSGGIMAG